MINDETHRERRARKLHYSRLLRKNMTAAETLLWKRLRNRLCKGMKFRRQVPLLWFIVDFICMEQRLIIEIDGAVHEQQKAYDAEREQELEKLGYRILRFSNDEVLHHEDDVMMKIIKAL
ncbi:MAG TPA: endonuclease domain-containing protein [Candidatus Peribacteraceae bacterium]|nr:endonuclease domain-containing protein [Candidatus Peribacteraceae bacterium]